MALRTRHNQRNASMARAAGYTTHSGNIVRGAPR